MTCRHRRGTTSFPPPATRRPQRRHPPWTPRARSPPRTAADPLAGPPAGGPATAGPAYQSPALPSLSDVPSQHLAFEVLRRLVESAHYLKVGVALQMVKTDAAAEGESDAAAVGAKALDEVIAQLGERTMPELAGPGGRARAKAKLTAAVAKRYDGDVMDVYFTEFVMQ